MREPNPILDKLRSYAVHVDEMSWHGGRMVCDLCTGWWNNGSKRGEPATPEKHDADCPLVAYNGTLPKEPIND